MKLDEDFLRGQGTPSLSDFEAQDQEAA